MLEPQTLSLLKNNKNLLAFSGGVDSTALFFLLQDSNIKFDIAIVNYGVREKAKEEIIYAQELANKYNLKCYLYNASSIDKNFEANARKLRYDFFEETIESNNYENLLTAHHLGDRFEWMLMQFCKGAGCAELSGMNTVDSRDKYKLVRPLLHLDKSELLVFLDERGIKYFIDQSNFDESIKRNHFRHKYSNPLLKENLSGIKKSFSYIDEDIKTLISDIGIESIDDFSYFKSIDSRSDIFAIDKHIKSLGHIITANERELLKDKRAIVIGRKYLVVQENDYVFINQYTEHVDVISKEQKEIFRSLKIEPKLRPFLSKNDKAFEVVKTLLS